MVKAIIYVRGYDKDGQIEWCTEYAEKKGYIVTGIVIGDIVDLLDAVRETDEQIDRVLVRSFSRVSRNRLQCFAVETDLKFKHGIVLESTTEQPRSEAEEKSLRKMLMSLRGTQIRK